METAEDYSHRVYTRTLSLLEERSRQPEFEMAAVEAEYEALCVYQGHGFTGRNFFKDAEIQGQLDAYQVFIYRGKNPEQP